MLLVIVLWCNTSCASLNSFLSDLHTGRGEMLSSHGLYSNSIKQDETALKINSNNLWARYDMGYTYIKTGQYDKAIEVANDLIKISPIDPNPYQIRAVANSNLSNFELAIEDSSKAVFLSANWASPLVTRSWVYYTIDKYEASLSDINKAITLDPYNATEYDIRGLIYTASKDYSISLDNYNRAIELDSSFEDAYFNRGEVYSVLGLKKEAIIDFETYISLSTNQERIEIANDYIKKLSGQ